MFPSVQSNEPAPDQTHGSATRSNNPQEWRGADTPAGCQGDDRRQDGRDQPGDRMRPLRRTEPRHRLINPSRRVMPDAAMNAPAARRCPRVLSVAMKVATRCKPPRRSQQPDVDLFFFVATPEIERPNMSGWRNPRGPSRQPSAAINISMSQTTPMQTDPKSSSSVRLTQCGSPAAAAHP